MADDQNKAEDGGGSNPLKRVEIPTDDGVYSFPLIRGYTKIKASTEFCPLPQMIEGRPWWQRLWHRWWKPEAILIRRSELPPEFVDLTPLEFASMIDESEPADAQGLRPSLPLPPAGIGEDIDSAIRALHRIAAFPRTLNDEQFNALCDAHWFLLDAQRKARGTADPGTPPSPLGPRPS